MAGRMPTQPAPLQEVIGLPIAKVRKKKAETLKS
jgi:hypothetical protein